MTHKIGDWVALETDDGVCTGTVSEINITRSGTRYTVDVIADHTYRSRVEIRHESA